jgi:voltage-dependent anion channel protein 2
MAAPVKYADIGKSVSDLLTKDIPVNSVKLEANTQTVSGVKFTVSGSRANETGVASAELKAKYYDAANGITFTDSYDTSGALKASAELADAPVKGVRAVLDTTFSPSGKSPYGVKITAGYKREYINLNTTVDVLQGPNVAADLTFGNREFVFGALVNVREKTSYDLALGYAQPDYAVAFHARNQLQRFSVSYYHQVDARLSAGAVASYSLDGKDSVSVEAGTNYVLDKDSSVKARIDNNTRIGLGYTQRLRPGVKATFGTVIDPSKGTTQIGLNLNLDA